VPEKYLPIYLNDHLAGSAFGVDLARRTAGNNRSNDYGTELRRIAAEIEEDRRTLEELMDRLGVERDRLKLVGSWALEKVGRLKLNGEVLRYSPLSRLEEIESLELGVQGKLAMWLSLRVTLAGDKRMEPAELDTLIARATSQRDRLEALRLRASHDALGV
jgi:hypothetical protein